MRTRSGPDHYTLEPKRTREGPGHCKSNPCQSKLLWNFVSHVCICSLSGLSTAKLRPISSLQNRSYFGRVHLGLPRILSNVIPMVAPTWCQGPLEATPLLGKVKRNCWPFCYFVFCEVLLLRPSLECLWTIHLFTSKPC
jgi:hypothetical protein